MNYNIWLLCKEFQGLSIGGKIAIVAAHILVVLLLILLEEFRVQRHEAKKSLTTTLDSPLIEPVEKPIHTICAPCERQESDNHPNRGIRNTLRNNLIHPDLYCRRSNSGNTPLHPFHSHISTIINKLRRRVNQSGKEPSLV
jgi:hypothetical protein